MIETTYMKRALELATRGKGKVSPNPMVGAVIVKNGEIIGEGWHQQYGGLHAEREALASCVESPAAGTMYVTLEPCCHYGKTPPCTEAVINSGLKKVVVATTDPNPLVAGQGLAILKEAGIEIEVGMLAQEAKALNKFFFHYIRHKTPYVTMKYAMTLDGKIATRTGASKWITGKEARQKVHEDRSFYQGIMIGIGTAIKDDPLLTCRIKEGRNPIRIICDSHLRLPLSSRLVETARDIPTYIATTSKDKLKAEALEAKGCNILSIEENQTGKIDLVLLMKELGQLGLDSLVLEGGAELNYSALQAGIVSSVQAYIAPKIFGGQLAKSPVAGLGIDKVSRSICLGEGRIGFFGDDFLLEYEVMNNVYRNN